MFTDRYVVVDRTSETFEYYDADELDIAFTSVALQQLDFPAHELVIIDCGTGERLVPPARSEAA